MKVNLKTCNDTDRQDVIISEISRVQYHIRRYKRKSCVVNNDVCSQDFYDDLINNST